MKIFQNLTTIQGAPNRPTENEASFRNEVTPRVTLTKRLKVITYIGKPLCLKALCLRGLNVQFEDGKCDEDAFLLNTLDDLPRKKQTD
jgi:hypothetical protein